MLLVSGHVFLCSLDFGSQNYAKIFIPQRQRQSFFLLLLMIFMYHLDIHTGECLYLCTTISSPVREHHKTVICDGKKTLVI